MKMLIPILIFTSIFFLINFYVLARGWQALPSLGNWRYLLTILAGLLSISFYIGMANDNLPIKVLSFMQLAGGTWFFALLYLLAFVICIDLVRVFNYFFHFLPKDPLAYQQLKHYVVFGAVVFLSLTFIWGKFTFDHTKIVPLQIDKQKLDEPVRAVMISDVHLGYTISKTNLARFVDQINASNPDLVLICGDLVDRSMRPVEAEHMADVLRQIKATYGVYMVLGNHEYYGDMPRIIEFIKQANITLLRDETVEIGQNIVLIGRDDRTNLKRKSLAALCANTDPSKFRIVLDHQPYHLEESANAGVDLQLSGHVHDGQVWPGNLIAKRLYECSYGSYQKGSTHYYISSGIGIWGPHLRIGTQSEIVQIALH